MSNANTTIEWTDATWNIVTGCSKVSPGCARCYAERLAPKVFAGQRVFDPPEDVIDGRPRVFTDVRCHEDRLDQPLHWKKPRRIFVNSMSDLFHEEVPDEFIDRVFAVMALAPQHTFQILTKRAERMRAYCVALQEREVEVSLAITRTPWWGGPQASPCAVGAIEDRVGAGPLPNVWLGVSVENQHFADERIPLLLQTPAAIRFISYEPALGPVDLSSYLEGVEDHGTPLSVPPARTVGGCIGWTPPLDWVIVGGESGPGARPFDLEWARSVVKQCKAAGVPVFVKQLGSRPTGWWTNSLGPGFNRHAIKDKKGGDPSEWPSDLRVREFPANG